MKTLPIDPNVLVDNTIHKVSTENEDCNLYIWFQLPRIGLLEMPSLPDTWLSDKDSTYAYTAGGLTLKPVRPMDTWSLAYSGMMR